MELITDISDQEENPHDENQQPQETDNIVKYTSSLTTLEDIYG